MKTKIKSNSRTGSLRRIVGRNQTEENKPDHAVSIEVLNEKAKYWRGCERQARIDSFRENAAGYAERAFSLEYAADVLFRETNG